MLESITFPEPVISVSIEPKTRADQDKMGAALGRLAEEDPTFRVRTDEETGQTIIDGMGELHLEVIVDRMMREFRVEANVGRPQVAYRETITIPVKAEGRHVRQSGGKGQYGHVVVEFEPQERGEGYEFEDKIVGGSVPREYIPPVDAGHPRGDADGRRGRLPDRRHQGDAGRRLVPRGRLVGNGVQDRRFAGAQGGGAAGPASRSSSRSWRSRSRRRTSSWATSSAT